jgi:nucleoside-diphosphate-sugar epimerase
MRIVVTGAHGFVGLNITSTLARQGHDVVAVSRREPDEWVNAFLSGVSGVRHVVADLSQPGALHVALGGSQIDAVVHAAVVTATTLEVERAAAAQIVHVNGGGTIDALEAARLGGARRFVYVSSPSAIGAVPDGARLDESVPKSPETLYGITKDFSEEIVRRYGALHDVQAVSVRIAQPYGPGERATRSRVRTSPIYEWMVAADAGEELPTGPFDRARDWTYIDDTAKGIAMLATSPAQPLHGLYHLALERQSTVREVVELLREAWPEIRVNEHPDQHEINPNIAGSGSRQPLDTGRFRGEFGWAPETDISEGMQRYVSWWKSFETEP